MAILSAENGGSPYKMSAEFATTPSSHVVPFTRACAMWPFVDFLDAIGAPTESYLQLAGIPSASLEQSESLVPLRLGYSFLEHAANAEGIDNLGLIVAQQTSGYDLGVFGELLREAFTVYEFFQTVIKMIRSLTSGQRFWLTSEGSQVRLHQHLPGNADLGFRHADIYTVAILLRMLRSFTDDQWGPEEVCLLTSCEPMASNTDSFRDARIIKGQAHSSFTIPRALLQQPIPLRAKGVQLQQERLENSQPSMPKDLENSVKQIITSLLPSGCPDVHLAAEAAGLSTRTLQRRLGEIGSNYSYLLKRIRMQLAAQRLTDTTMPVNEIAVLLGYRDPANFTRAFRCKTGVSPQNYRAQVQNPP